MGQKDVEGGRHSLKGAPTRQADVGNKNPFIGLGYYFGANFNQKRRQNCLRGSWSI